MRYLLFFLLLLTACPPKSNQPAHIQKETPATAHIPSPPPLRGSLADVLRQISGSDTAIQQILAVRNGFYGPDGEVFRDMIHEAFSSEEGRRDFLAALKYQECVKEYGFSHCLPSLSLVKEFWTNSPMYRFGETQLKRDIDELQETLQSFGLPKSDFNWLEDEHWEPLFGYILILEPHATELLSDLAQHVTAAQIKSWTDLGAKALAHSKDWKLPKNSTALPPGTEKHFKQAFKALTGYEWDTLTEEEFEAIILKIKAYLAENKGRVLKFLAPH